MNSSDNATSTSLVRTLFWLGLIVALIACASTVIPKLFVPANKSDDSSPPPLKFGCIDRTGRVVIQPKFDSIYPFESKSTNAALNGAPCLINGDGHLLGSEQYQAVEPFHEGMAAVCSKGKWGFVDESGRIAIPLRYDGAVSFSEGLARVSLGAKSFFIDKNGSEILRLNPDIKSTVSFKEGLAAATTPSGWTFKDAAGRKYFRSDIEDVYPQIQQKPQKVLAVMKKQDVASSAVLPDDHPKWGVVNDKGEFVIKPDYVEIPSINSRKERILLVGENFAALTDIRGAEIARFESAFPVLFDTRAIVKSEGKWGLIDLSGRFVVPPQYDEIKRLRNGLFVTRRGKTWLAVNEITGQSLASTAAGSTIEELISMNQTDLQPTNTGDKWGASDAKTGRRLIACLYDRPVAFGNDDICTNSRNGKPMLIDRKGREIAIDKIDFEGGGAAFYQKSLCGFIDRNGKWKIPPRFDEASDFTNGCAAFRVAQQWGLIEPSGKIVCKPFMDAVGPFSNDGLAPFRSGAFWGFLDRKGNVVIEAKFDEVRGFNEGLAAVHLRQSGWGFVDSSGKVVVPLSNFGVSDFSGSRSIAWKIRRNKNSPFEFSVLDKVGNVISGPYGYALPSGSGLVAVTDDFVNWKLLDKEGHDICVFKHFSPPGIFNPGETLLMMNDRMVIALPANYHRE